MNYKDLNTCLVCNFPNLKEVLNLGDQPLINNLKDTAEQEELKFPLKVNACPACSHHQLSIAVDPNILFNNYLYTTGTSKSHNRYFEDFAKNIPFLYLKPKEILDIGCNDGSLLREFKKLNWICTGIEPAKNLAETAYNRLDKKAEIVRGFFPHDQLEGYKFDVITAFNVFAHNSDPKTFLKEMALLLNDDGRIYIQTTVTNPGSFYHEHISYFTPRSMFTLIELCGLHVKSFKIVPMHKESYLFEIAKIPKGTDTTLLLNEPLVGYGSAASGMVLLNKYNIKPEYVVDDNPLKQGKFIPGVNIPIFSQDKIIQDERDLNIIILAYNLFDEIKDKIKKIRPNKKDIFINLLTGESFE